MKPSSVVVTSVCDIFARFMIVFGFYIGGFQGGAIVAASLSFVLAGHGGKRFTAWARESVYGALVFIGLGAFFVFGCLGFQYHRTISLMNVAAATATAGAFSLVIFHIHGSVHMMDTGAGMGGERGHDRFDR